MTTIDIASSMTVTEQNRLAKRRSLNITIDDLSMPATCPVLGIPIVFGRGLNGRANPNNPSLDRFDNELGYVKGNVRVISLRANHLKSDATAAEIRAVLAYMENGGVS
jgi:hypothetical protein